MFFLYLLCVFRITICYLIDSESNVYNYVQYFNAETQQTESRRFLLYVPTLYRGTLTSKVKLNLVLHLHGGPGSTGVNEQGWNGYRNAAENIGFVIAFPDGSDCGASYTTCSWNIGDPSVDVPWLDWLISEMKGTDNIHPNIEIEKVFISGYSQGGYFSYFYTQHTTKHAIDAIGPTACHNDVAFSQYSQYHNKAPTFPPRVVHFHGKDDTGYNAFSKLSTTIDYNLNMWGCSPGYFDDQFVVSEMDLSNNIEFSAYSNVPDCGIYSVVMISGCGTGGCGHNWPNFVYLVANHPHSTWTVGSNTFAELHYNTMLSVLSTDPEPSTCDPECQNGHCVDSSCVCEVGWTGISCQTPSSTSDNDNDNDDSTTTDDDNDDQNYVRTDEEERRIKAVGVFLGLFFPFSAIVCVAVIVAITLVVIWVFRIRVKGDGKGSATENEDRYRKMQQKSTQDVRKGSRRQRKNEAPPKTNVQNVPRRFVPPPRGISNQYK